MDSAEARDTLKELGDILGLTFAESQVKPLDESLIAGVSASIYRELNRTDTTDKNRNPEEIIENMIELRKELRADKQFQQADMIRKKLDEAGIALDDTPQGTVWKIKR